MTELSLADQKVISACITAYSEANRPVRLYGGMEDWIKPDARQIAAITVAGF
jgi:hypothetical protein